MSILELNYSREGEKHIIKTDNDALGDIIVDNTGIPPERRHGTSRLLLASSALMCFAGTMTEAMDSRDLQYTSIKAKAFVNEAKNKNNVDRVTKIDIEVEVDFSKEDEALFERVKKIMKQGCFITNSLHEGIEMSYKINE